MLEKQNNTCSICKMSLNLDNPYMHHIDHNHKNGKVRGLLCLGCNNILNFSSENVFILTKAILYLKNHNKKRLQKK